MANPDIRAKMSVSSYKTSNTSGIHLSKMECEYNPSDLSISNAISYNESKAKEIGITSQNPQFTAISPRTLSCEFLFDTLMKGSDAMMALVLFTKDDVNTQIKKFESIVSYNPEIHRPNYVKLVWGQVQFSGVITSYDIKYEIFDRTGKPIRAKISAKFTETIEDSLSVSRKNSSPDLSHYITVKEGDTLPMLAFEVYGNSSYYLEVAKANNLRSYRYIPPGTKLLFPPLNK